MIIVNADDFGYSNSVNIAISELFKKKVISSTTLMANMPGTEEAVLLAKENNFIDSVGFHFNLIEGESLSAAIRLCPRLYSKGQLSYKRNSVRFFTKEEKNAIRQEFKAQLDRIKMLGFEPSHMDSHQHVHTEFSIYLLLRNEMKKENIKAVRIGRNVGVNVLSKFYKLLLNTLIKMDGFKTVDFFSSLKHTIPDKEEKYKVEYMCHPIKEDGIVVDAFSDRVFTEDMINDNLFNYRAI